MQVKLTIQERLKDLRVERGLTLEQLAEQTGLSKSALGKYEADDFKDISPFSIVMLAKFYGVSTDYLLGMKLLFTRPMRNRSPIHLESFVSSLFPFTAFTHLGLAMTTRIPRFSRMLNTGTQYFPVDSMQTSKQLCSRSQSAKRFKSELKVLNRFF